MISAAELLAAVAGQLLLRLSHKRVESGFDVWESIPNMCHERRVQCLRQELCSASRRDVSIRRMMSEEVCL